MSKMADLMIGVAEFYHEEAAQTAPARYEVGEDGTIYRRFMENGRWWTTIARVRPAGMVPWTGVFPWWGDYARTETGMVATVSYVRARELQAIMAGEREYPESVVKPVRRRK